jgi:ribosomal protein S18 acetylase RimI-like enzyme
VGDARPAIVLRRATIDDYPAFARLFPELGVDDPLPSREAWASAYVPFTRVATDDTRARGRADDAGAGGADGGEVVGYCYCQEYDDTGYVRNVAVAPGARRRGVGRALMEATGRHLRALGKTQWRLNVAPKNSAAIALYEGLGMRTLYASRAVRVPRASLGALPESGNTVRVLPPARDAQVERLFALPRGQLGSLRDIGRLLFEAVADAAGPCLGLAVFASAFPGAFPFRVVEIAAVRPLVDEMYAHVAGGAPLNLVIDDDERVVELLVAAGAEARAEFLHLGGVL